MISDGKLMSIIRQLCTPYLKLMVTDCKDISEPNNVHWSSQQQHPEFLMLAGNMYSCVRFEVFTAVTMKNGVLWDVTPCGSCKIRRFGGT
jgi:hypothetical protein